MKNLRSLFSPTGAQPLFSFSDAEGFFGLMVDNLVQYILIVILLTSLVGLQREFVISSVLPAVAMVPVEAAGVILIWIGLVMTSQAFQTTPRSHAPAVALGLIPALAAWGTVVVSQTVGAVGAAMLDGSIAHRAFENLDVFVSYGLQLPGLVALSQGFMLSSVVWAATAVCLVERRLGQAAAWMGVGAVMAFFGFIHVGEISVEGVLYSLGFATGAKWAAGYALTAVFFMIVSHVNRKRSSGQTR